MYNIFGEQEEKDMKKILKFLGISMFVFAMIFACAGNMNTVMAKKNYTVSPKSKPINKWHTNKKNKHYVMLRSRLMKMEKKGGGTLTLKKGTYTISNTLYIPSNVTIKLKDGVKLVKGKKSGTKDYKASSSLFQFVRDSKHSKKGYSKGYKGEKNIKIIGEGTVTIDMKNFNVGSTPEIGFVMANNKNVVIENIEFKNIKYGHFIEMDGCKDVTIRNCKFSKMTDNKKFNKEAINIDTNDSKTGGFSQKWSKRDKTPNLNVTIENCTFMNLVRAVGTHQYSKGKYHTNIKFINNQCMNVKTPVGIINWKDSIVSGNTFTNATSNSRYNYTILMAGVGNLTFTNNVFTNCKSEDLIKFYSSYQTAKKTYSATTSKLSQANIAALKNNRAINCSNSGFDAKTYGYIDFLTK